MRDDLPQDPHKYYEDMMAMVLGTLFVALGVAFYTHSVLITGSTAGLALLLNYVTGWGFGFWFFAINVPFYYLAIKRMGWSFTLRTFAAIGLVSLFSELTQGWVQFANVPSLYAALMGGA
ncbi:MAG: YitT family protein, partial [Vreelandella alkaliphila]